MNVVRWRVRWLIRSLFSELDSKQVDKFELNVAGKESHEHTQNTNHTASHRIMRGDGAPQNCLAHSSHFLVRVFVEQRTILCGQMGDSALPLSNQVDACYWIFFGLCYPFYICDVQCHSPLVSYALRTRVGECTEWHFSSQSRDANHSGTRAPQKQSLLSVVEFAFLPCHMWQPLVVPQAWIIPTKSFIWAAVQAKSLWGSLARNLIRIF